MELKALYEEMQRTWHEFKAMLERQEAEIKKHGEASAETKANLDRLNARLDDTEKRIGAVEGRLNQPSFVLGAADSATPGEAKSVFLKWARTGVLRPDEAKSLVPAETKVFTLGDQTQAGYLAPVEYVREILKGVVEFSPLRSVARVRTTTAKAIQIPKRTGVFSAVWIAETGTRAETTGLRYGLEEIPTHEMYAMVDVSFAQLEDAAFDLESEFNAEFAEQFGVAEGAAFISGNAVGRPEGILANAAVVGAAITSTVNDSLAADDLITAFHALKEPYARNATWLMRRSTVGFIRRLKAAGTGEYLWQPGLMADKPPTILGQPYLEALDMPAIADQALAVAVGDFRRGYIIVDRVEIAVTRDPYTQAAAGNIRFHARKRVGGQVVIAEAIQLIRIQ